MRKIINHLKDNSGAVYILFLMLFLCMIILTAAIFGITKTAVATTSIYNEIENSADCVMSKIKADSYTLVSNGSASQTEAKYTETDFLREMNRLVNAVVDYDNKTITRMENDTQVYKIYNVRVEYDDLAVTRVVYIDFDVDITSFLGADYTRIKTYDYSKHTTLNVKIGE